MIESRNGWNDKTTIALQSLLLLSIDNTPRDVGGSIKSTAGANSINGDLGAESESELLGARSPPVKKWPLCESRLPPPIGELGFAADMSEYTCAWRLGTGEMRCGAGRREAVGAASDG